MKESLGRHVLAEYYGIDATLLDDVYQIERLMLEAAQEADATIVQVGFHHFSPIGVSGVVVIQESHLTIHTWPEYGYAAVDIFTCGDTVDPRIAYDYLKEKLGAKESEVKEVPRGTLPRTLAAKQMPPLASNMFDHGPIPVKRDNWFTTRQEALATSLKLKEGRILKLQTEQQRIEVFESEAYGKFMALDGQITLSDKDEGYYHEMLVHIPMRGFMEARSVCILGGGDGGLLREVCKYTSIDLIEVIEWDPQVKAVAEKYFPAVSASFKADAVKIMYQSIEDWIAAHRAPVDLVLLDFTLQPFQHNWLPPLQEKLSYKGRLAMGVPNPQLEKESFLKVWNKAKKNWGRERIHLGRIPVPTLPGGAQYILYYGPTPLNLAFVRGDFDRDDLRVYNDAMHQAAFALPNEILKIL